MKTGTARLGIAAVVLTVLLGGFLRMRGLEAQSMLLWDEGLFTTGAQFLAWRWHQPQAQPSEYEGYPVFNEKPLHVLLQTVVSEVVGHRPATGRWLSAVFALATLALVAGRLLRIDRTSAWPALAGTMVLAGSTYHAYYSRLGLHEIDSVFWLLLACTVAAWARGFGLAVVAGLLGGLCLGSSYRWLPLLPLLGLRCLWGGVSSFEWRSAFLRGLGFVLGFAVVMLGCEGLYRWTFAPGFTQFQPASYWAAMQSKFTRETHFTLEDADFFPRLLFELDGLLWLAACAAVLVVLLRFRRGDKALNLEVLGFILVPLVLFSISEAKVSRAVSVIAPWLALAVGVCVQSGKHKALACGLFVAVGVLGLISVHGLPQRLRSSYPEAVQFVAQRSQRHLSSEAPLSASILGRSAVVWADLPTRALPATSAELQRAIDEGAHYLILDWEKYLWYNRLLANLEQSLQPVLTLPNPCASFPALLHESYLPRDVDGLRQRFRDLDQVLVYQLKGSP